MLLLWSQKKETIIFRAKKFFLERQQNGVVFQLSVDFTNGLRVEHKNKKPYQRRVKKSTSFESLVQKEHVVCIQVWEKIVICVKNLSRNRSPQSSIDKFWEKVKSSSFNRNFHRHLKCHQSEHLNVKKTKFNLESKSWSKLHRRKNLGSTRSALGSSLLILALPCSYF